jgi:predicted Zn-dependent protease with MMP-like domain
VTRDFEERVRQALDALPPDLARGLENVAVVVEEEHPGDPGVLGLFEDAPYILHELAHYFGIDEQRLAELGYA